MNNHESTSSNSTDDEERQPPDETLIASIQAGDSKAFDTLVNRHRGRIFAMIRQMIKNEADAWDLSQEVFIKAWRALPRFEAKAQFSTWLYRIAHNTVYDWLRKKRPESSGDEINDQVLGTRQIDPSSSTTPSMAASPDDAMGHHELREKIELALQQLSPDHRQAVILKDVHGLAYREIAEVTNSSIGTVMSRLHYARQKLQTLLKDEYQAR